MEEEGGGGGGGGIINRSVCMCTEFIIVSTAVTVLLENVTKLFKALINMIIKILEDCTSQYGVAPNLYLERDFLEEQSYTYISLPSHPLPPFSTPICLNIFRLNGQDFLLNSQRFSTIQLTRYLFPFKI